MICKICSYKSVEKLNIKFNYNNKKFSIFHCYNCEAAVTYPFLSEANLKHLYKSGKGQDNSNKKKLNIIMHYLRTFFIEFFYLKKIKKIFPRKNNSVLDFGCGDGYLGLSLKKSFSKVYFSDFDSSNNNLHSPKNNLFYIPLKKVFIDNKKFDLIILRHVLEHMPNPKIIIHKLSKLLNKNGKILIEVPAFSIDYFWMKVFKESYFQWEIPFHLFHFSPKSIKILFQKNFRIKFLNYSQYVLAPSVNRFFFNKQSKSLDNPLLWILLTPLEIIYNFFIKQNNCALFALKKK